MKPQEYIQSKLDALKQPIGLQKPVNDGALAESILKALLSKKFRKYSVNEELIAHIKNAIRINIEKNEPINITFLHGAYKLWRLEETPDADWAELFALMYYSNWVKPICEMYEQGVWFDFYVDDLIVPKLDNIDISDIRAYIDSYQEIIDFLTAYQPTNLKMTITTVGGQFESEEAFEESLANSLEKLSLDGLPELTPEQKAMVELNTKVTQEQTQDPQWREKVFLLHNAYMPVKAEPGYHKGRPEKIMAFNQPLPSGTTISVGSTKDSIMKFWIGAGVLKKRGDSFRQIICSPSQLEALNSEFEDIKINGLEGKNFNKIRVAKD